MANGKTGHGVIQAAGYTDAGPRADNQDAFLINQTLGLYVVADGVGGRNAGEIAAELTCNIINQRMAAGVSLEQAVIAAHHSVIAAAQSPDKLGMASTVIALHLQHNDFELAWVGDSRAFLWDGALKLISRDHSHVQQLFENGIIPYHSLSDHPHKHILNQALGGDYEQLQIGTNRGSLAAGEVLLLCTDGLSDVLSGDNLLQVLSSNISVEQMARKLVELALSQGARDNCSCVCIKSKKDKSSMDKPRASAQVFALYRPEQGQFLPTTPLEQLTDTICSGTTKAPRQPVRTAIAIVLPLLSLLLLWLLWQKL